TVVRSDCVSNLGDIVVSLKKTFIIVIEGLFCTMSWSRETSLAGVVRSRHFLHVTQFLGWTPIDFWIMLM
ncbi:MAG: hypothetical protein WB664_09895, partial [Nitrososphaeraceae archaeon]